MGIAYVIMPWAYYCYYGDTVLLNRHYEGMKQWVAYLGTRTDARGIIVREEPDGWCLGDWCAPGKKMELPEPLVNTAYYYHSADLMSKVAAVLGKEEDRLHFDRLCTRSGRISILSFSTRRPIIIGKGDKVRMYSRWLSNGAGR